MGFREFVKERRLSKNLSLRRFCELVNLDPSNWSKIERGLIPLSINDKKLKEIARVLGIEQKSQDYKLLFDLATIEKREIPDYVYKNEEVLNALPAFFRTASKEKPTEEELNKLIEIIKNR